MTVFSWSMRNQMIQLAETQFVLKFYGEEYMASLLKHFGWDNRYILFERPEKLMRVDLETDGVLTISYYDERGHIKTDVIHVDYLLSSKVYKTLITKWFEQVNK